MMRFIQICICFLVALNMTLAFILISAPYSVAVFLEDSINLNRSVEPSILSGGTQKLLPIYIIDSVEGYAERSIKPSN